MDVPTSSSLLSLCFCGSSLEKKTSKHCSKQPASKMKPNFSLQKYAMPTDPKLIPVPEKIQKASTLNASDELSSFVALSGNLGDSADTVNEWGKNNK